MSYKIDVTQRFKKELKTLAKKYKKIKKDYVILIKYKGTKAPASNIKKTGLKPLLRDEVKLLETSIEKDSW